MAVNSSRALQLLLDSEEYGPKLVRLNRADQTRVLRLLDQGRYQQASRQILELDTARRQRRAVLARAKAYASKPKSQRVGAGRPDNEEALFWRLYDGLVA